MKWKGETSAPEITAWPAPRAAAAVVAEQSPNLRSLRVDHDVPCPPPLRAPRCPLELITVPAHTPGSRAGGSPAQNTAPMKSCLPGSRLGDNRRPGRGASGASRRSLTLPWRQNADCCTRLRSTCDGVTEITFRCGFSDSKYFTRQFGQIMGQSPRRYRQQQHLPEARVAPLMSGLKQNHGMVWRITLAACSDRLDAQGPAGRRFAP